jgi:chemotaxis-related protein WspB
MKVLVFTIGPDRYALPLAALARVVPVAGLKQLALAPPFMAGLLDLHGEPVPVIDLSRLAGFAAGQLWFDTRIILADYPLADGSTALIGMLAEHVTGVETIDPAQLRPSGVDGAPFLGQVVSQPEGLLQLLEVGQLLLPEVRALLFPDRAAA